MSLAYDLETARPNIPEEEKLIAVLEATRQECKAAVLADDRDDGSIDCRHDLSNDLAAAAFNSETAVISVRACLSHIAEERLRELRREVAQRIHVEPTAKNAVLQRLLLSLREVEPAAEAVQAAHDRASEDDSCECDLCRAVFTAGYNAQATFDIVENLMPPHHWPKVMRDELLADAEAARAEAGLNGEGEEPRPQNLPEEERLYLLLDAAFEVCETVLDGRQEAGDDKTLIGYIRALHWNLESTRAELEGQLLPIKGKQALCDAIQQESRVETPVNANEGQLLKLLALILPAAEAVATAHDDDDPSDCFTCRMVSGLRFNLRFCLDILSDRFAAIEQQGGITAAPAPVEVPAQVLASADLRAAKRTPVPSPAGPKRPRQYWEPSDD
jgi:hypothetical protein